MMESAWNEASTYDRTDVGEQGGGSASSVYFQSGSFAGQASPGLLRDERSAASRGLGTSTHRK